MRVQVKGERRNSLSTAVIQLISFLFRELHQEQRVPATTGRSAGREGVVRLLMRSSGSRTNAGLLFVASAFYCPVAKKTKQKPRQVCPENTSLFIVSTPRRGERITLLLRGRVRLQKSGTNGQGWAAHLSLSYAPITRKVERR